jgi:hypothetical protein
MKVKRMGIKEILRRIWLFSANNIKSSESFSKQPTQLIIELNSSLRHIIVTLTADILVFFGSYLPITKRQKYEMNIHLFPALFNSIQITHL